jgi:hypothetical protein
MSYGMCFCGQGYGCTCQGQFTKSVPLKSTEIVSVAEGLSFNDLPTAIGEINAQELQFFPPRRYLSPSHFMTNDSWEEIEEKISTYFTENGIAFLPPSKIAVFSVTIVTNGDRLLCFDIYCCPTGSDTFIVEFRRVKGCGIILNDIFIGIRNLFGEDSEEEEDV